MYNFNGKKGKKAKIIIAIVVGVLVLAMIATTVIAALAQ